ncbi:MAG: hypothetical protein M3261_04315, partial [Thermoproteota archaeon]|nr:hypothetical protein [Thermoproteota archaeon]
ALLLFFEEIKFLLHPFRILLIQALCWLPTSIIYDFALALIFEEKTVLNLWFCVDVNAKIHEVKIGLER